MYLSMSPIISKISQDRVRNTKNCIFHQIGSLSAAVFQFCGSCQAFVNLSPQRNHLMPPIFIFGMIQTLAHSDFPFAPFTVLHQQLLGGRFLWADAGSATYCLQFYRAKIGITV